MQQVCFGKTDRMLLDSMRDHSTYLDGKHDIDGPNDVVVLSVDSAPCQSWSRGRSSAPQSAQPHLA